jgi:hypothetical protein
VSVVVVIDVVVLDVVVAGLVVKWLVNLGSLDVSTTAAAVSTLGTSMPGCQMDRLHTSACRPRHQTIDHTSIDPAACPTTRSVL